MKKPLLGRVSLSLLLMGACTPGLNEPAPVGGDRTAPDRAEGTPLADLPTREDLLRSSKYLEFPNFDAFTKAVVAATQTEPAKQFAWEKIQDFVSLKQLLETEIDRFAATEGAKITNAAEAKQVEARLQNDLKAYRGFITYSNENAFELAVSPSAFGHLLNRDGVVKIGPDLYQFSADRMKVIRGGDEAKIPELFGTTTSDPAQGIEVTDIRAGGGPVLSGGRTEQMLDSKGYDLRNLANTRRLQSYVELFNINGDIQFWIKFRALWRSCSFCAWVNDRTDIGGYGSYQFSGQAQTPWIRSCFGFINV